MGKSKKFGTFSGVFTPSILTILGVIMYLRFPTIIGQAGLINTIAIIIVAHIISITTSLSVASLSTDKTVKTGGTYFMISRSLGLPIGGTLGLALFVGLSFSVSLYLIGFAESFLAYFNFDSSINSVRIVGTAILILVTTITFISTSLAIKSQYFIMATIVLSLFSIFLGTHEYTPSHINFAPLADAAPFMVLFGIFFPAVTGFEAGVSMSGDLKNPKKSLPLGAVSAVLVGLAVYIGLALFYSFTVDSEILKNDKEILFKISLIPELVIAGIWGATLSSALGSILGAPRILQAIAMDKIAPKFFALGTGKTNEPRNALLLTFVIAEAGILIGELDVIARIVSMFFITTYAFLNLASAIESWSSSDFRPAFKIPRFVSILGALSAFIVMILLDFLALAGAVIVLGILLFYLKRKELVLESGDAWSSFWTNLAKKSLLELTKQKLNNRNWRPNIILFSGGEQARPHLVELGLALSGKLGSLTDFELLINPELKHPVKSLQINPETQNEADYFKRQFVSSSVENGIKTVTSIYGFSGFEPNTIMLGWSRSMQNANFLVNILTDLKAKNLNVAFLDYDKENGFGKKENIDVWWDGKGRHLSFALSLIKFLLSDKEWRDAKVRILIINNNKTIYDKLYRNTVILLDEKRINAEVKIVYNENTTKSNQLIINEESATADLILLGFPQKSLEYTAKYIESISQISELPASLLILNPSNEFEEINLLDSSIKKNIEEITNSVIPDLKPLPVIENHILNIRMIKLDADLQNLTNLFIENTIIESLSCHIGFIDNIKEYLINNLHKLEDSLIENNKYQIAKTNSKLHYMFLDFCTEYIEKQGAKNNAEIKEILTESLNKLKLNVDKFILDSPEYVLIPYYNKYKRKEKRISIHYRQMLKYFINIHINKELELQLLNFNKKTSKLYFDLKKIVLTVNDLYKNIDVSEKSEIHETVLFITNALNDLDLVGKNFIEECRFSLFSIIRNQIIDISSLLQKPKPKQQLLNKIKFKYDRKNDKNINFHEEWASNAVLLNNALYLDCHVLKEEKLINSIVEKNIDKIVSKIDDNVFTPIDIILKNIENCKINLHCVIKEIHFSENFEILEFSRDAFSKLSEFIDRLPEQIEIIDFTSMKNDLDYNPEDIISIKVEPRKIVNYYITESFVNPFYNELEKLQISIKASIEECNEANSLLNFKLDNLLSDIENNSYFENDILNFLNKIQNQLSNEKTHLKEAIDRFKLKSVVFVEDAFAPIYSHTIVQAEKKISNLLREKKSKNINLRWSKRLNRIKSAVNNLIVGILYKSSDGMLLAQKYLKKQANSKTSIREILDIVESEMPNKNTLSQIPLFYRTLFSSKSLINDDFWIPMEEETSIIKTAIKRHKDGYGGAVMITGVHGSGKSTLSRYVCRHYFKKDRIFNIKSPKSGSVSIEVWHNELRETIGGNNDIYEMFSNLPVDSVVVINDLELWWERSVNGLSVIEDIVNLIKLYGKKILFIINSNTFSFNQINKVLPIESIFLSIVECKPFDSLKLQQLILSRHKSSGFNFYYKNLSEKNVFQIRLAVFFHSVFNYSKGVQGVAMNAWLKSIKKIDNQNIYISKPEIPNTDCFDNLNMDWLIVIALFIQHKNMNSEKLARVMNMLKSDAEDLIINFYNSGILEIRENDIYSINRYVEPFLVEKCIEKGII